MFICHKCGYRDFTDNNKINCPVCGENITIPKYELFLFLSLVGFIIFSFLSMFEYSLNIISTIFIILAIIMSPLAIMEAARRTNEIQDGFRIPNYPSEIIKGNLRVPDFKVFNYVHGIKDDEGVKKILLETYKDGLNIYYNKLQEIETINYPDIVGLELHEENDLKISTPKSIAYATLLGLTGGFGAGMIGGALGGIENKNRYVLEIQIKYNDDVSSLYITSDKSELFNLAKEIEHKVNYQSE